MEKVSTRKIFVISILCTIIFGVSNLFLNRNRITAETNYNLPTLCIAAVPISVISIGIIIIELSLILYFAVAAINGFIHIKTIIRIVVRSLIWYPVINFINGLAIILFNVDISAMGFYKILYYIPFTLLVGLSICANIKSTLNMSKGKSIIVSVIGLTVTSLLVI